MYKYLGKKVTVMACSKCNINCEHCYISYTGDRSSEELKKLVSKLSSRYKVEINGAEILTDFGYLESFPIVGQDFLMTNGLAIYEDPSILDKLKAYGITKIFMSYHYGIQDDISVVSRNQLETNIKNVLSKGFKLRLYTTITSTNYRNIQDMVQNSKNYGAYSIRFTNFIKQGNAVDMDNSVIMTNEQIDEFLKNVSYQRRQNPIDVFKITRCGTFGKAGSKNFCCYAGTDNVVITPDNKVYPCIFLAKPGFEIGYFDGEDILLYSPVRNDGEICVAKEVCNADNMKVFDEMFRKQ